MHASSQAKLVFLNQRCCSFLGLYSNFYRHKTSCAFCTPDIAIGRVTKRRRLASDATKSLEVLNNGIHNVFHNDVVVRAGTRLYVDARARAT